MGSVSVEASGSSEQQTDIGGFGGFMGQEFPISTHCKRTGIH